MISSVAGAPAQLLVYPVLEAHLTFVVDGALREWIVPSCCFHDLTAESACLPRSISHASLLRSRFRLPRNPVSCPVESI